MSLLRVENFSLEEKQNTRRSGINVTPGSNRTDSVGLRAMSLLRMENFS
jgi:hypothetical protein